MYFIALTFDVQKLKIVDEFNSDYIELELLEVMPDNLPCYGDRNIKVKVKSRNFTGTQTVWLDYNSIEKFVTEINTLEEKREGKAEIISMSPDEFLLHVGFYDLLGHIYFEGYIAEHFKSSKSKIAFYIRPDTSMFRQYVYEFNRLLID